MLDYIYLKQFINIVDMYFHGNCIIIFHLQQIQFIMDYIIVKIQEILVHNLYYLINYLELVFSIELNESIILI